jgi:hypothetical protein
VAATPGGATVEPEMTIFANERDSENMSVGTSEPDRELQAVERPIPGDVDFKCKSGSLELNRLEGGDVLVVSKLHPGNRVVDLIEITSRTRMNVSQWCL